MGRYWPNPFDIDPFRGYLALNEESGNTQGPGRGQFPVGWELGRVNGRIVCMAGNNNPVLGFFSEK